MKEGRHRRHENRELLSHAQMSLTIPCPFHTTKMPHEGKVVVSSRREGLVRVCSRATYSMLGNKVAVAKKPAEGSVHYRWERQVQGKCVVRGATGVGCVQK